MTYADFPCTDAARAAVGDTLYGYLLGRAADEADPARDRNAEDLAALRFVPRVLTGAARLDLTTGFAGTEWGAPLGIGAFAGDRLFHPEGLLPLARIAARLRLPMAISEETVTPLAQITALHDGCWLQLRAAGPLERIARLVRHAADNGARGMIFTVLAPTHPVEGLQPGGFSVPDELQRLGWTTIGATAPGVAALPSLPAWGRAEMAAVAGFCAEAGLPFLLKGVLHPDDLRLVRDLGPAGLVVSNIGLRQSSRWSGPVSTLLRLGGAKVEAAAGLPLILDGGLRSGSDIVAACCLGARMSFVVRPLVTALVGGGEAAALACMEGLIAQTAAMTHWLGAETPAALSRDHLDPVALPGGGRG